MITLIIDDHIPFIKGVLEPFAKVIYAKGGVIERHTALQADGLIIRTRTRCDARLLEGTPVKFISTATIGFDHIDTGYCSYKAISWHYAPGCNASSVKQYVASVLAHLSSKKGYSLHGKKIGIVGVGHVGSQVAKLAEILGMEPMLNDPPRERHEGPVNFVTLEEIQESCDLITFHVPLVKLGPDKTFHMAGRGFFEKLKKAPLIINTSRGPVADSGAVRDALKKGKIAGYAADVWEHEPYIDPGLLEMSMIATPHIAGYSVEGKANGTTACVRAASKFFQFGIDDWLPSLLPPPGRPEIMIDAKEKTDEQIIAEAILACYDIMEDDAALRLDPSRFEDLRNHYPVRREFEAYKLIIINPLKNTTAKLRELGFSVD